MTRFKSRWDPSKFSKYKKKKKKYPSFNFKNSSKYVEWKKIESVL